MNTIRLNGKVSEEIQNTIARLSKENKTLTQGNIVEISVNLLIHELKHKSLMELYADYIKEVVINDE